MPTVLSSPTPSRSPSYNNLSPHGSPSAQLPYQFASNGKAVHPSDRHASLFIRNKFALVWGLRFLWVVLVVWCEVGEFFGSISTCHFPDSQLRQPIAVPEFENEEQEKLVMEKRRQEEEEKVKKRQQLDVSKDFQRRRAIGEEDEYEEMSREDSSNRIDDPEDPDDDEEDLDLDPSSYEYDEDGNLIPQRKPRPPQTFPPSYYTPPPNLVPTHVVLLSDPQLPHHRMSFTDRTWLVRKITRWMTELYLRKSWNVVMKLGRIDTVIVAGDMMDWGRGAFDDEEYQAYLDRFRSIFRLPANTPMYFTPGNQDIGLGPHRLFSTHSKERYAKNFSPPNMVLPIANHTFILLDSISLVEEDYRRYAAEVQLGEWEGVTGGVIEFVKNLGDDPPNGPRILVSHIPLARPESASCGSKREKGRILKGAGIGYQNLLGSETTRFLMKHIEPSVVYSGDDHDYCEYWHPNGVREVTLKTFSPAMEVRRPGFQLLSLIPPSHDYAVRGQRTYADVPCLLPDQTEIYLKHYLPFIILTFLVLFWLNLRIIVNRSGGWVIGQFEQKHNRRHSLSPNPAFDHSYGMGGGGMSSRKDKPLPLTLPSRRSSQTALNQALMMSPGGGQSSATPPELSNSRMMTRSATLGTSTPTSRRIARSAPASPLGSPSLTPSFISEFSDAEHGYAQDGLYMSGRTRTLSSHSNGGNGRPTDLHNGLTEEPSNYFLSLPEGNLGLGISTPLNSPGIARGGSPIDYQSDPYRPRPPQTPRRVSRPSDWASAAKAKDMTVIELLMDTTPAISGLKKWMGKEGLRTIGRWMGGRNGVIMKTWHDIGRIAWPPLTVWLLINLMYFV